jgi:DNA-binding MarR family transcriptional regulator
MGREIAGSDRWPLPTLLSQALVAYTIEFDNEFEHQMPHRTSRGPTGDGPWLVSLVMWANLMRFVGPDGVRVGDLETQGGNLAGMERWGYVTVAPDPADTRAKPPRRDWIVRATADGELAQSLWPPLFGVIEQRWLTRFGNDAVEQLRDALRGVRVEIDLDLPDFLPVLGYGLWSTIPAATLGDPRAHDDIHLVGLLAQVLLAFTLEFEREADVSLAISANILRLLELTVVRMRDLPKLSGVSKEAIAMGVGFLEKNGHVVLEPDPDSRARLVRLTAKGRAARDGYRERRDGIEARWRDRFGRRPIRALREPLERLVGDSTAPSPLFRGLEPYPDGWRASTSKPETLPHSPMVLHRGGFPDGS